MEDEDLLSEGSFDGEDELKQLEEKSKEAASLLAAATAAPCPPESSSDLNPHQKDILEKKTWVAARVCNMPLENPTQGELSLPDANNTKESSDFGGVCSEICGDTDMVGDMHGKGGDMHGESDLHLTAVRDLHALNGASAHNAMGPAGPSLHTSTQEAHPQSMAHLLSPKAQLIPTKTSTLAHFTYPPEGPLPDGPSTQYIHLPKGPLPDGLPTHTPQTCDHLPSASATHSQHGHRSLKHQPR